MMLKKRIEVAIGPMPDMNEEVISAWAEPSSSGTTVYEAQLRADGVLSCTCPGWTRMATKDKITGEKTRNCTHCRAHRDDAQAILDGKMSRVFKQDPDLMQKLFAKRNTGSKQGGPRRRMIMTEGVV